MTPQEISEEEVLRLKEKLYTACQLICEMVDDDPSDICISLLDIPEELDICDTHCQSFNTNCVLRYLKYYKPTKQ